MEETSLLATDEPAGDVAHIADETLADAALLDKLCASTPQAAATTRVDTARIMHALIHNGRRPSVSDVYGRGPMLVSDIPVNAKKTNGGVCMGIDEAGRGPVLGPMTYGAAFWANCDEDLIPNGFHDSKALTPEVRSSLFEKAMQTPQLGFVLRVLHASEISRNMLRKDEPYNLNAMSHDAAIDMIRAVLNAGVKIDTCYVDTVGVASHYQGHLERIFGGKGIKFVVEKKADAKYATCSAASVVAKVARDRMIEAWKWTERNYEATNLDYGSGYPSDPKCKKWMDANQTDPVFCFPDLVRFSRGPAKKAVEEGGVSCEWEGDEEEEEKRNDAKKVRRQQQQMQSFVGGSSKTMTAKKRKRSSYFEKRGLHSVARLHHG